MADRNAIWVPAELYARYQTAAARKAIAEGGRVVHLNEIAADAIAALERGPIAAVTDSKGNVWAPGADGTWHASVGASLTPGDTITIYPGGADD